MNEFVDRIRRAEAELKREMASAMISGTRACNLPIECDRAVYLVAPAEQLLVASAPIAGLQDKKLESLLDGEPVLFVYFSEVEFRDGAREPAGFYAVQLRANQELAEFIDAKGNTVGTGILEVGARAAGGALRTKRVSADIEGPDLCYEVCVKVCLTLKVDLPGPINPEFRICVEIVIKI